MICSNKITSPLKKLLLTLLLLYFGCVLVLIVNDNDLLLLSNKVLPAILFLVCLYTAYSLLKVEQLAIWTPLPWFLAACGIYYGFGPLIYFFGNKQSIIFADYTATVDSISLMRVLELNCAAICCVIAGSIVGIGIPPFPPVLRDSRFNEVFTRQLLKIFLFIGIPIKYLVLLPAHFGITKFVVPGSLVFLATLPSLSIIFLSVLTYKTELPKYRIMLWILISIELIVSLMMLAKTAVIITVLMVLLGRYAYKPDLKYFISGALTVTITFIFFLTPFVNYARDTFDTKGITSLTELSGSFDSYREKKENKLMYFMPGVQAWWLRLNYANIQAFTIDLYNNGKPGTSFELLFVALTPRFLFPDKPTLQLGTEFNKLLTGTENSQSSPGFFAESFWNGGWTYTVLSSFILGIVYSIFTKFSMTLISANKLGYLPIILSGIMMGARPDDWYISTVFVLSVQSSLLYLIFRKIFKLLGDE
jgi:hypothetical protein